MRQEQVGQRRAAEWRALGRWIALGVWLVGCGGGAERAAQHARLAALEQDVQQMRDELVRAKTAAPEPSKTGATDPTFKLGCPQPWTLQVPAGAVLWHCRAPAATPDGLFAQCSVVSQPQVAIEIKDYFEYALNVSAPWREAKNLTDKPVKHNGRDAFEATFEVDPKPVPMKMMGMLVPHETHTYAITCSAPSAAFESYTKAFRHIIDTFAIK